jgi:hypothetical protein
MTTELDKLAQLEALGATPGSPVRACLFFLADRCRLAPAFDKTAAARQLAAKADASALPERCAWIGGLVRKLSNGRTVVEQPEKKAGLGDLFDTLDDLPSMSSDTEADSVMDIALQYQQRKNYMRTAVRRHLAGKRVLPPAWWEGTADDWRAKLDTVAKRKLAKDTLFS